ncbi:MAG: 3-hydroxybutyrate dehydrogenase [Wenzhouxiangellaceae bacterium]
MHILITGAGSGIGAGLARSLAKKTHHVIVTDLDPTAAVKVAESILADGHSASAHALDVTSDESVHDLVHSLDVQPQVLINNAGLQHVERFEDFPIEKWDQLIQVMLVGVARLTRQLLPAMRRSGFGRIVNIGSIHSLVASPYKSAYVAAKHGLLGLSKTLALETADTDITINTLCPAYVRTPLVEAQIADQARTHGISEDEVIEKIMLRPMPKKAFITIEELADITEFLIGPSARNITGQCIVVDGGWTIT